MNAMLEPPPWAVIPLKVPVVVTLKSPGTPVVAPLALLTAIVQERAVPALAGVAHERDEVVVGIPYTVMTLGLEPILAVP